MGELWTLGGICGSDTIDIYGPFSGLGLITGAERSLGLGTTDLTRTSSRFC